MCNDGNACTGTGREGIGFDTCTGGVCAGVLDPQCNDQCEFAVPAIVGANLSTNASAGDDATSVDVLRDLITTEGPRQPGIHPARTA